MRMSEGVEWGLHACIALDWIGDRPVSTAKLASTFELPAPYLNKHLQALARAGIVTSTPGPRGGFRLARDLSEVTLLDVVTAIEGREDAFRCQEIRQRGAGASSDPDAFRKRCAIARAMRSAEIAYRRALAAKTLADIRDAAERDAPRAAARTREWHQSDKES